MTLWRRKRADASSEKGVVVLGQELARATKVERRHRRKARGLQSPLAEAAYDAWAGDYDLHRFVASPVDERVREFATAFGAMTAEEAAESRAALRMDDLYTLITFVRRCALASVVGRSEPTLQEGLAALTAVDEERVDWRDLSDAAELLAWAMVESGLDHAAEFRNAERRLETGLAASVRAAADRPAGQLEPGRYRRVQTPAGPALAETYFAPFDPSVDLVEIAFGAQEVVEADVYRIEGLTVEAELPAVWLTPRDSDEVGRALGAVRAGVSMHARIDPRTGAQDQQLIVFLVEASSEADAHLLSSAATPTESHEALGVAHGAVCCVLVASAVVMRASPFEKPGALERFGPPLTSVLKGSIRPAAG